MENKFITRIKNAFTFKTIDFAAILISMLVIGILKLIFGDFNKWISEYIFLYTLLGTFLGVIFAKLILGK